MDVDLKTLLLNKQVEIDAPEELSSVRKLHYLKVNKNAARLIMSGVFHFRL